MNSPLLPAGPEIPLNTACEEGDVCADSNAECRGLTCLCKYNYFQRYGVCCEYPALKSPSSTMQQAQKPMQKNVDYFEKIVLGEGPFTLGTILNSWPV